MFVFIGWNNTFVLILRRTDEKRSKDTKKYEMFLILRLKEVSLSD